MWSVVYIYYNAYIKYLLVYHVQIDKSCCKILNNVILKISNSFSFIYSYKIYINIWYILQYIIQYIHLYIQNSLHNLIASSSRNSYICHRSNIKKTTTASLIVHIFWIDSMCNSKHDPCPSCSSAQWETVWGRKRVSRGFLFPSPPRSLPLPPKKRTPQTVVKTFLFAFCFKQRQENLEKVRPMLFILVPISLMFFSAFSRFLYSLCFSFFFLSVLYFLGCFFFVL